MSRHAVITGAGSGIGLQVAQRFAGLGFRLTLVDINPGPLADAAEACREAGSAGSQRPWSWILVRPLAPKR